MKLLRDDSAVTPLVALAGIAIVAAVAFAAGWLLGPSIFKHDEKIDSDRYKELATNLTNQTTVIIVNHTLLEKDLLKYSLARDRDFVNLTKGGVFYDSVQKALEQIINSSNSKSEALSLASNYLDGYMTNQTKVSIFKQNMSVKAIVAYVKLNINDSVQNPVPISILAEGYELYYDPTIKKWRLGGENGTILGESGYIYNDEWKDVVLSAMPYQALFVHGKNFPYLQLWVFWRDSTAGPVRTKIVSKVYIDGELAYDSSWFSNVIDTIESTWSELENNIDYFVNQYFDYYTQHPDELPKVPPSMAVKEFSQQYNQTGFPGYAAAALASMGVPCTDLNKTVTIEVNGTKLEGWMVGWDNATFEANKTYVVPANVSAYILTDDGLFMIPQGTSFKVLEIQDVYGNKLDNLTSKGYTTAANPDDLKRAEERLDNITKQVDELTSTIAAITNSNNNDWLSQFLGDYGNYVVVGLGAAVVVLIVKRR